MTWPYDAASTVTIAVAATALLASAMRRLPMAGRVALVLAAAGLIRLDAGRQQSLHLWDESYHAVVAKRLIAHPLTPTLYERPAIAPDPDNWTEGHIWLHKPPLAMWLMAASMAVFGENEMAVRLPGLLLSTLGVLLVFLIGRRLYDERAGLLAAAFQAVSGLLVSLASGRRVADHVDTTLITCVELAVWLLVAGRDRSPWRDAAAGAAMGAGILAKSLPALIVVPIALTIWIAHGGIRRAWARVFALAAGAAIVCGPWLIYSRLAFPVESAAALRYTLRHITTVVENQGGPWWTYLRDLPRLYGELVYLPIVWLGSRLFTRGAGPATADRGRWADLAVAVWLLVPYVVFSMMATKLPAFVAIGAPALFLVQALFWLGLRRHASAAGPAVRTGLVVLLVLLAVLPARALLAPTGPLEIRDRNPDWVRDMRTLDARIESPDAIVFNHPRAIQAMFYSRHDIYGRMPTHAEVRALQERNVPIVIYAAEGSTPSIPAEWRAIVLR